MLNAPLTHMPAIVRRNARSGAPARGGGTARHLNPLYVFLKPEIDQGQVTVLGDHAMPNVRIRNKGMFPSGSATINTGYYNLLERIGNALKAEKGPVQVIGYTDNQPIHTVRFPSNFQLSTARAEAARDLIVKALGDPDRVTALGKADADPLIVAKHHRESVADQNRRIEVVLRARLDHGRRAAASLAPAGSSTFIGGLLDRTTDLVLRTVPLAFLEFCLPRAIIIAVMVLIWLGVNFWLDHRRRKNDDALMSGVTATAADPSLAASAEEMAAMRDKLTNALNLLKKASKSRGYLYEQPWYAIIGPPGAGKTTALLTAGLSFPLAAEMGQGPIAGVGGTRMCEWMFTDDAVLIDAAWPRYTTQDSDAAVGSGAGLGHLPASLLKRTRPRQQLNGVIIAIRHDRYCRLLTARATGPCAEPSGRRIKELSDQLGVRMPVYAIFTKADLLAGFMEFFDDLDREKRGAVYRRHVDPAKQNRWRQQPPSA